MNKGIFTEDSVLVPQSDSVMDLDYMDELLLEGCWLETANRSEFLNQSTSNFNALFDSSFTWPALESSAGELSPSKNFQEDRQRSSFPENLSVSQSQGRNSSKLESLGENASIAVCSSSQSGNCSAEEFSRRWWIGPRASISVIDRLIRALGYIKDWSIDKDVLLQIWVPVNKGGRLVLTTNHQPFSLDRSCRLLACYRDISVNYHFPAEEDSKEIVGLPGRVFTSKVPEWTPDVQLFRKDEYARVRHAQRCDIRGTLAVPVFEQGSRNCVGVIEVVLTSQRINYRPELESVCKALEAVDLRSSDVSSTLDIKACESSYQSALPEIIEVLRSACETHRLPLAQIWVPCIQQGKGGCRHSDENIIYCVSTVDSLCCIADPSIQGFSEACSEHHLLKGQGIVGRAFTTNQPCFSPDISLYPKTYYPLSHHARMFGLRAAVAIRMRGIYTGSTDFVLEFFLPLDCNEPEEHKRMLSSLSDMIQKVCWSLRVITDKELEEETALPVGGASFASVIRFGEELPEMEQAQVMMASQEMSSPDSHHLEVENVAVASEVRPREVLTRKSEFRQCHPDAISKIASSFHDSHISSADCSLLTVGKTGEKRRAKADKTINLQILRQYFAGSLKDAAKSVGVCPTTLKRICRQHGIKRWPSRKIKKVGHSLQKIKRVIDSVQGASGTLKIESFYSNFPELASPNLSRTGSFSNLKSSDDPEPLKLQPGHGILSPHAATYKSLSSSFSQKSSSSSQCYSTGTQQRAHTLNVSGQEDSVSKDDSVNCLLKRVRSDAGLHLSSNCQKLLPKSRSQISLIEPPKSENLPIVTKETGQNSQHGGALRIKVTYGEEKIRFRLQNSWGYTDLMREIGGRFGIHDTSGFHLKYLDDDFEWVLLTCDADLEECIDVSRSSESQTIKLSLLRDSLLPVWKLFK